MAKRAHVIDCFDLIERASRDELAALQFKRLSWSIRHAYEHVRTYRDKCESAGVHPDDFRSLEDLGRFPFTTKQDLRDNYPFGMFAVPREQVVRVHASSGNHPQADCRRLYRARHRDLGRAHGVIHPRGWRSQR
jgi:phenylacetate-CoA ligase